MTYPVIRQDWEESEREWGVRPDGYSLHTTRVSRDAFVKTYWDSMPDEVPDEYSRPSGDPYVVEVSKEVYVLVKQSPHGIRKYGY